jgi:SAM-dependent methyltransferase
MWATWRRRILHSVTLRARILLGKGFRREFFEAFYAEQGPDAWSYARNAYNQRRFEFIVGAIPPGLVDRALEIACAEGQMTAHLARRAARVVGVDLVAEAVRRARENCAGLANVTFFVQDVRDGLPPGSFDAVICSDVLYYLSRPELSALLRRIAAALRVGGSLVASEYSPGNARLPSRLDDVLRICAASSEWVLVRDAFLPLQPDGDGIRVAVFRRASPERD